MTIVIAFLIICPIAICADSLNSPDTISAQPQGNSLNMVFKSALKIYSKGITDTENHNCPMTPSCSAFAREAFAKTSAVKAILLTVDRLLRDNSFARKHYKRNEHGLLIDPIERYIECEKRQRPY